MADRSSRASRPRAWAAVVAGLVCALLTAVPAGAATFVVDSAADGPGACPGTPCTLRAAVAATKANGNAENDTITLPAGDFALTGGELLMFGGGEITINGSGPAVTRIRQTGAGRVLHAIAPGGRLRLTGLTVQGGRVPADDPQGDGGGIRSIVGLELDRVVVYDNRTESTSAAAGGGGVSASDSDGHVQINDSTIARNHAAARGGGLSLSAEEVTIRNSRVSENTAGQGGGGIDVVTSGVGGLIEYTAITGNVADGPTAQGGGMSGGAFDTGFVTLQRSLLADNYATADGGGWLIGTGVRGTLANTTVAGNEVATVYGAGGVVKQDGPNPMTLVHSTFADNVNANGPRAFSAGGPGAVTMRATIIDGECLLGPSALTDGGFNVSSSSTCGLTAASSAASTDPLLAPLADNGGPTLTHAITTASPASSRATASCPLADQRGAGRTPTCDSGAFEVNPSTAPLVVAVGAGPPGVPDRDGDGVEDADDACPDVAAAGGCPPPAPPAGPGGPADPAAPTSLVPPDVGTAPGGSPADPLATLPRRHAELAVSLASLRSGRLAVAGRLASAAGGRVSLQLRAAGRTTRLTAAVRRGRFTLRRRLPARQRRARTGRLTIAYAGDAVVAPARTVLTAAPRAAGLRLIGARLTSARLLRISGRLARAATGRVTVVLEPRAGEPDFRALRIRVRPRAGRWTIRRRLPATAARGGQLTVTFPGAAARRIRGQQLSRTIRAR